ncbi:type II secretion system secretin GspD [Pusillimonas sp. CC-YST705]|uniref:Type II secretion system secretin GspD n=1 Tax=Mesopusillimonas faecipullorum TaxID=2755040 RepID=A0ABS8CEC0_9BURK|nr:type II secretion system secretin GspD [Mesopusillimonas faecipullorum]MCB5364381.1 type II secretion system secretin GspD [Mesopusillimonas faecipullorum]
MWNLGSNGTCSAAPALRWCALVAALSLAGCAATDQQAGQGAGRSALVVHTSSSGTTGSDARPVTPPPPPIPARRPSRTGDAASSPASAGSSATIPDSGERTMLNFVDAELQGVVRALARFTGRNFVVDPRVKGQLTLVSEAPVSPSVAYSMLLSALRMQGFAVVEVDGVSRVVPEADAKLLGGSVVGAGGPARSGELATRVFSLRYENAASLVPVLRPMVSPNNPVNAHVGNNTLVITDYVENLDRIAEVIERVDTPSALSTDVIPIRHGVALDVAALALQLLEGKSGDASQQIMVVADPRSNAVLVRATSPERLKLARDLIERIDSPESRAGNLHVVYLRNAQATHLAEVLRGALTGQGSTGGGSGSGNTGLGGGSALSGSGMGTSSGGSRNTMGNTGSGLGSGTGGIPGSSAAAAAGSSQMSSTSSMTGSQQSVAFSAGGATVQADPTTNTLIISAPPPLYRSLREVIDLLDQRRAQVLVESLIVEVNAEDGAEFGIQWMAGSDSIASGKSAFIGGANLGGTGIGTNMSSGVTSIDALGQGLSLGVVRGTVNILGNELINLGVLARAMQKRGGVNILSTPNLMTLDNEVASIVVGRTVPFVTGSYTTTGDGASNPFQTVQREDVGLTLRIRPQISEGGTVKLSLYQEVSSIDPTATTSASSIVTRKRALETNVLVDDGQIIVLGGLLEDEVSDMTHSVPLLGDIPFLGQLFRYESRSRVKTNLMVFLRPHIVRNAQDGASVTLDRYSYMRALQSNLPVRDSWLMPDANASTLLPDFQRNEQTGLLDLRAPEPQAVGGTANNALPASADSAEFLAP